MAQTGKTQPSRLTPSPKALQKALAKSAQQAHKLVAAFGGTVPGIKPKGTERAKKDRVNLSAYRKTVCVWRDPYGCSNSERIVAQHQP